MYNKPVAWMHADTGHLCSGGFLMTKMQDYIPLYSHPVKELAVEDAKQKLIKIMGAFDLATGHADTFNELLNSLEVELRDVLGYYREALRMAQEK